MSKAQPLEGAGPGDATEGRCLRCGALVFVSTEREHVLQAIAVHFLEEHPEINTMIVDEDFIVGPAPHRCDLCGAVTEPPWWNYHTPIGPGFRPEDPHWLVCDDCHAIITGQSKPLRLLLERCTRQQIVDTAGTIPSTAIRNNLKPQLRGFLDHVQGDPVRCWR